MPEVPSHFTEALKDHAERVMAQRSLLSHFHHLFIQQTLFHGSAMAVHRITCLVQSGLRTDGDNEMSTLVCFATEDMGL
jgi:hypothetical protein